MIKPGIKMILLQSILVMICLVVLWSVRHATGWGYRFEPNPRELKIDQDHIRYNETLKEAEKYPIEVAYGFQVMTDRTPDFRKPEGKMMGWMSNDASEYHRPYPLFIDIWRFYQNTGWLKTVRERLYKMKQQLGCYCAVAYMRSLLISTCAMITHRHSLTTASALEDFLRVHGHRPHFHHLLDVMYDRNYYGNATRLVGISRIHYHPKFSDFGTNFSHPFPVNDLAVMTLLHPVRSLTGDLVADAFICYRPTTPLIDMKDIFHFWIVGYQFIKAYNRNPNPFSKYGIRTRNILKKCPKVDWGWFHCIHDRTKWAPVGLDSGAILHVRRVQNTDSDGLLGLNSFSTDLRKGSLVHYFTAINNYDVFEFLYDAYMGFLPYRWLDKRFYDSAMRAPVPKPWYEIPWLGIHDHCAFYTDSRFYNQYCVGGRMHKRWWNSFHYYGDIQRG